MSTFAVGLHKMENTAQQKQIFNNLKSVSKTYPPSSSIRLRNLGTRLPGSVCRTISSSTISFFIPIHKLKEKRACNKIYLICYTTYVQDDGWMMFIMEKEQISIFILLSMLSIMQSFNPKMHHCYMGWAKMSSMKKF